MIEEEIRETEIKVELLPSQMNRNKHELDLEAKLIHTLSEGEQPVP